MTHDVARKTVVDDAVVAAIERTEAANEMIVCYERDSRSQSDQCCGQQQAAALQRDQQQTYSQHTGECQAGFYRAAKRNAPRRP